MTVPGVTREPDGRGRARLRDADSREHGRRFDKYVDACTWRRERLAERDRILRERLGDDSVTTDAGGPARRRPGLRGGPAAVYRHLDRDGTLLYVGMTG